MLVCQRLRPVLWAFAGVVAVTSGCTKTFRLPPPPEDPVEVWFVHEAMHKGIVLPSDGGGSVEWGVGEWAWYAEEANTWLDAPRAVLWPSDAALSRRVLRYSTPEEMVEAQEDTRVLRFDAERKLVAVLRSQLERQWEAGRALAADSGRKDVVVGPRGEVFVPLDASYWMFWNCNDAAAGWLRALGCDVQQSFQSWSLAPYVPPPVEPPRPVRTYLAPPPGTQAPQAWAQQP